MKEHTPWQQISRKTIYNTPHLRVYEDAVLLPSGEKVNDYSIVEFNDVAMVVATDTDGNLLMLQEYRYAVNKTMWNLPAGTFKRGQEDPAVTAVRELKEETGYEGDAPSLIAELHDYASKAAHSVFVYRIKNARQTSRPQHEITEHLRLKLVKPERVKELFFASEIQTTSVLSSLALAMPEIFGGQ